MHKWVVFYGDDSKYKVWVKPSAEMTFLYGNHITKGGWIERIYWLLGLARISESVPQYGGVIVYNMNNVALGFGVTAKSTEEIRSLDAAVRSCGIAYE